MPFWLLYRISDVLFVVIYYCIGYRKEVVLQNLKSSFPEKSSEEIYKIARQYYLYLCDLMLETLKTLTISKKEMMERCILTNESVLLMNRLYKENKNLVLVMGHYGNWEWAGAAFSYSLNHKLFVIYKPLANKYFDRLLYKMRTRSGTGLIPFKDVMRGMLNNKNQINTTAFIADQTPQPDSAFWTTFLNQDTPVFMGTEKISQKLNYPIVYTSIKRIKRGYYSVNISLLFENPAATTEGEITITHTKQLEAEILNNPIIWLWSHRRWKHKRTLSSK